MKKTSLIAVVTPVILIVAFLVWRSHSGVKVPQNISQKINFPAFIIKAQSSDLKTDETSFKFDDKQQVFSFIVRDNSVQVTITEQAYPEVVMYDKLVGTLNQYGETQTKSGKVARTRPKTAGDSQVAVANINNQTLLFAKAGKDLTDSKWQRLFNSLDLVK